MDLTPNAATRMEKNFVDRKEYINIFDHELIKVDNNSSRVLVLYGQPGIGKTALSIKLRQHCNTNKQAPVVARYSFKDGYQGKLNVLDTLANDICTDTNSYNMYYYYLAQTVYYALQKRRPENPRIPEKYCNLLSKLPFLGLAVDLFTAITNYAWEELKIFLSKEKTVFRGFLQSLKRDQIIDNLPRYFACNLADETKEGRKAVVILDTMDKVPDNDDDNRKWLRTLVNNAKGTLFVLTDRRGLDWSGYTVAAPIRQEKVGELAEEDQRKLIKNVGIRQPEIVDAMVEGSCGVPFWLELCLDMYDNNQRDPEDYKGTQWELLDRFLNSMPAADKRTLERLACAVSFDQELFTTLVERFGTGFDNPADRFQVFLRYRFLQPVSGKQGAPERYVIHDLLLRHIRDRLKKEEPTKWGETNGFILEYYYSIGNKLKDDGHYYDAEHYWELEKNQAEDYYGREDTRTAASYNNLAGLYRSQGRYAEAENVYNKALEIRKKVLPADHPDLATSYNNLAGLYQSQGRYAEAENLYNKALEIDRSVYPDNHPEIATNMNNLALLYQKQGRYAEAEDLYNKDLQILKKVLPADHPDLATSYHNLALLYQSQGRYAEAENVYNKALEILKTAYEADHPYIATSYNNLAGLYQSQGRYAEAEDLYNKALEIEQKVLEADNPSIATSYNNLAGLYRSQGRYAEAEDLYNKALEIWKNAYEADHPYIATSYHNLAGLYQSQGRYAEAEDLYNKALEIDRSVYPDNHPEIATNMNNLALLYQKQGRYAEAENFFNKALVIRKKVLPADHPDLATSYHNLAGLYESQGRYAEAEDLYNKALEIRKKVLPADHPDLASSYNNLAGLYKSQGRYAEAEDLYNKALEILEQKLGKEHPTTVTVTSNTALFYKEWGRTERAIELFEAVIAATVESPAPDRSTFTGAAMSLVELYTQTGNEEEAARYRGLLDELEKLLETTDESNEEDG